LPLVTDDGQPVRYPLRAFVQTWGELANWWTHYDADTLAAELTDEQFENFLTTAEGTVRFADALHAAREAARSGHDCARSDHRHGCRVRTCSA
jgi:ParB family chromosome partitioning protein